MLRSLRHLCVAAALGLVLPLAACSSVPGTPLPNSAPSRTRTALPPSDASLQEQASWMKHSPAQLTPLPGSSAWLGSADLVAYRDAGGAECVFDKKLGQVLSWEPSAHTVASTTDTWQPEGYGVTVGAAAKQADAEAAKSHAGAIAKMRRTVALDQVDGVAVYVFQYDRYVNGVRVPDHVTVQCWGNTGNPGFTAAYNKPVGAAQSFQPKLTLPQAAVKAGAALDLPTWRFVSAELYLEPLASGNAKPKVVWAVTLAPSAGATASVAIVDPLTGEAAKTE